MQTVRIDKMILIGIWVETVFYGLNCALFLASLYVLAGKSSRRERSWCLIAVSSFLFSLSTAYVSVSLRQLLEAFIYAPPGAASAYFADNERPLAQTKLILYPLNVATQNLVLIWRFWAVWGCKWRIIVFPVVLQITQTTAAYVSLSIRSRNAEYYMVRDLSLVNWAIDLVINIGVTALIAYRLRKMGRSVRVLGSSKKEYYGVMRMIIESGVLSSTVTLVAFSIFVSSPIATLTALDSLVQLATITPLLIIVRVGLGLAGHHPVHSDHTSGSNDTKIEFTHPNRREVTSDSWGIDH
jgi:hypothetical protein